MKSVLIAVGASIVLSSFSVAFPTQLVTRQAKTVNIQAKTGDGDSSVGFGITVGILNPTNVDCMFSRLTWIVLSMHN